MAAKGSGNTPHLTANMFMNMTGTSMVHASHSPASGPLLGPKVDRQAKPVGSVENDPTRTFEDDDRAQRCEGRAMPQFRNSGDKIGQTVAVARYILQEGSFSATSGLFGHNWGAD
jgi:hypothetical protein